MITALMSLLHEDAISLIDQLYSVTSLIHKKEHKRALYRLQRDLINTAKVTIDVHCTPHALTLKTLRLYGSYHV
jgi:hypothetical protein